MTNEKPVMFEFPEKSGVFNDSSKSINDIIEDWTPRLAAVHFSFKQLGWNQYEIIDKLAEAKLKAQGWLSPEDQRPFCMENALNEWFHRDVECLSVEDMPIKQWPSNPCNTDEIPRYIVGVDEDDEGLIIPQVMDWTDVTSYEPFETASECGTYFVEESDFVNCRIKWFIPLDKDGMRDEAECARLEALGVKRYEKGGE